MLQHLNVLVAGLDHLVLLGQADPQLKAPQVACNTGTTGGRYSSLGSSTLQASWTLKQHADRKPSTRWAQPEYRLQKASCIMVRAPVTGIIIGEGTCIPESSHNRPTPNTHTHTQAPVYNIDIDEDPPSYNIYWQSCN